MLSLFISLYLKAIFYLIRATFKLVYTQEFGVFYSLIALVKVYFQIYIYFFPSYIVGNKKLFCP